MGYGLKVTGGNNTFIIDSDLGGARHLAIVAGPATSTHNTTYANFSAGDLIFAKPLSGSGRIVTDWQNPSAPKPIHSSNSGGSYGYNYPNSVQQSYIIARPSDNITATDQNGTYGLVVYDTNGTSKMYDSRQTSKGLDIVALKGQYQCPGGMELESGNSTTFVSGNHIYAGGTLTNIYSCMNSSNSRVYTSQYGTINHSYRGYMYRTGSTDPGVYYFGWFWTIIPGVYAQFFDSRNVNDLIIGELVS